MSLVKQIIESGAVQERLKFGHNLNIKIQKIDCEVRRVDGLPVNNNTFITLDQVDPESGKQLASSEINFFNIDPDKKDYALKNFEEQFNILAGIVAALGGDAEDFEDAIYDKIDEGFGDAEIGDIIFNKKKKGAKVLVQYMQEVLMDMIGDKIGDDCPLLKCRFGANGKGYINPKNEISWILPMDSEKELSKVTSYEQNKFEEALEKRKSGKRKSSGGGKATTGNDEFDDVSDDDEEEVEENKETKKPVKKSKKKAEEAKVSEDSLDDSDEDEFDSAEGADEDEDEFDAF